MPFGTQQSGPSSSKQWPDFYSILESTPQTDMESLRRSINTLYVKANEQSDHRELSTRFYNQVLSQKVLPQCRRILLNETSREAYNQQWHLHRDGAKNALSYQDFIRELTKGSGSASALLLSDDEISLLPSFHSDHKPPLSALKTAETISTPQVTPIPTETAPTEANEVFEAEEVLEPVASATETYSELQGRPIIAQVLAVPRLAPVPPRKKAAPVAALGALAALVIGGALWNASRPKVAVETGAPISAAATAPDSKTPLDTPLDTPLLRLNTLARNADFETGKTDSWSATGERAYVETPAKKDAKSGNKILAIWNKDAVDAVAQQTISGLQPGKYTLRAWVRRGGGQTVAEMFASDMGGAWRTVVMPDKWRWILTTIADIEVKNGTCTIGFKVQAPPNKIVNIDAVEFFKQ